MNKITDFLKSKVGQIVIWSVAVIAVGLFVYFTRPTDKEIADEATKGNVPATLAPSTNQAGNTNGAIAAANANANKPKPTTRKPTAKAVGFPEKKTPHFVSATIANNATLTQAPAMLTINFDATVLKTNESFVTVKKDQVTSATMNSSYIDNNTLTVRLNTQVTDGDYYVYYVACFADTGCKDGRFGYRLNLPQ